MLPLRNLEIFRAVAETGNFTRAAERLYLTQSAVSHAVRELEMQTGTVLLERGPKRTNPTAAGALLLAEAAPVLTACGRLERRMGQLERSAPIRLVSCITIAANWLPEILRRFQMQRPETAVQVEVTSAAAALQTLREGRADAVLLEGVRPDGPFLCRPFSKYSLAAFCAPEYPAAGTQLDLEAFCAERLLLREAGSAVRDTLDSALYLAGRRAEPVWTSVDSQALLFAAQAGLGITVLPELLASAAAAEGRLVRMEVEGLPLSNELLIVCRIGQPVPEPLEALLEFTARCCAAEEEAD